MNSVYLGVRIPDIPYEKVLVENVNVEESIESLIDEAEKRFKIAKEEIVLVYCGRPLTLTAKLNEQGVKNGVTIHVMKKSIDEDENTPVKTEPLTEDKIKFITCLFSHMHTKDLWKLSHPELLVKVLQKCPSIRDNLGALAILRDPILLSSMKTPESLEQISKQYNILLEAAFFVVNTIYTLDNQERMPEFEDSDSSSSNSSSDAEATPAFGNNNSTGSQITRQQLAAALAMAGAASRNSLSSIAERNLDAVTSTPGAAASPATPSSSSSNNQQTANPGPISTAMLNEALAQAALLTGMFDTNNAPSDPQPTSESPQNPATQYARELEQMREMGLLDNQVNMQALQISNGNVEAAINLVFSSSLN